MTAGVVATTLVREAASKMVSTVMASGRGVSERAPYALRYTTCPWWETSSTAPGI